MAAFRRKFLQRNILQIFAAFKRYFYNFSVFNEKVCSSQPTHINIETLNEQTPSLF